MQRKRAPWAFFLLVFALSVPFWLVGAATRLDLLPHLPVSALAAVCPVTAASFFTYGEAGFTGVRGLLRRAVDFRRIPAVWWAPTLLVSLAPRAGDFAARGARDAVRVPRRCGM